MSGSHRAPVEHTRKRSLTWDERAAADREAGRAERVPAPRFAPKRARRVPWYRSSRSQLLVGGGAIAVAVLVRLLVPSGGDESQTPLGEGLAHFGGDWSTADGSKYRITVTPLTSFSSHATADGCVPAPSNGFVNARFAVRLENRSGTSAPVPAVDFGANLDGSGRADPTAVHLPTVRTNISVVPGAEGASCSAASSIKPAGRSRMSKDQALDFVGVLGGIAVPVSPELSLIVRYFEADPQSESGFRSAEVLAPFPAFPVGS